MKLPKHTPGPWQHEHGTKSSYIHREDEGLPICHLAACHDPVTEAANARLIAAAPDLLALAQRIRGTANGLNATLRATDREYSASPLCKELSELVRFASEIAGKCLTEK